MTHADWSEHYLEVKRALKEMEQELAMYRYSEARPIIQRAINELIKVDAQCRESE